MLIKVHLMTILDMLSSIVIKYTLIDVVVFDYMPFSGRTVINLYTVTSSCIMISSILRFSIYVFVFSA